MPTLDETAAHLADLLRARHDGRRLMVGIAGPPGSGKSTLADALVERLNRDRPGLAAVLPMDGFHYDDAVLSELGLLPRKGAIETFDVLGLIHLLKRLKANEDPTVAVPVFDRSIEIARAGGRLIPRETGIIVAEGNYLLMRQPPWDRIKPIFDVTVLVATGEDTLRRRLTERWEGFNLPAEEIRRKVETNDLPNGLAVLAGSAEPDHRIET
ncbi:nucleoside triphosphate hydrolase [Chthonobacter rhizosphaerae]|uniref:nucleoside triphosphate hydrolase n=1 Tax=Chthonobacter rhizosphaerae TaxID=2735553 RepID=UPI0015EE6BC9|nr:nucleoside triphosphate hydrolase [Chthonobacter rhizosphaerae]